MDTRTVNLKQGLKHNDKHWIELTIRPAIVNDFLELDKVKGDNNKSITALLLRVTHLGDVKNPGMMVLQQLSANDMKRLEYACDIWDAEDLQDISDDVAKRLKAAQEKIGEPSGE